MLVSDLTVINNDKTGDYSCSDFTIAYRIGVAVRVQYVNGFLQVKVSAPPAFYVSNYEVLQSTRPRLLTGSICQ